jgi:hypothetical protein
MIPMIQDVPGQTLSDFAQNPLREDWMSSDTSAPHEIDFGRRRLFAR